MTTPTKTTNRLHLTDLDATRFEDLCLALIYPLRTWEDIRHYGRMGGDGGVDIFARETVEDAKARQWFVQCRRYKRASKKDLLKAVDDAIGKSPEIPDVLLLVVACDVQRPAHEALEAYAVSKGIKQTWLWTQSYIEATLHSARPDLLFTFFGISEAGRVHKRALAVRRNVAMKKRLWKELILKHGDPHLPDREQRRQNPAAKFCCHNLIIHSIDDTSYPRVEKLAGGMWGWFKVEPFDLYHNGLQVAIAIESVVVEKGSRNWSPISYELIDSVDRKRFEVVTAVRVGCIPFRNIVEIDTDGDEYGSHPHVYCQFADGGGPFEEFRYSVHMSYGGPGFLDPEQQIDHTLALIVKTPAAAATAMARSE